jgi:hypothetical protein
MQRATAVSEQHQHAFPSTYVVYGDDGVGDPTGSLSLRSFYYYVHQIQICPPSLQLARGTKFLFTVSFFQRIVKVGYRSPHNIVASSLAISSMA